VLELGYLACLATAYQRGPMSVVYPVARGTAPVLVLLGSAVFLATTPSAAQVAGVLLVGSGVLLVRGRKGRARPPTSARAPHAVFIAGYTVVDKAAARARRPAARTSSSCWPTAR
jgi:hypothetical protein